MSYGTYVVASYYVHSELEAGSRADILGLGLPPFVLFLYFCSALPQYTQRAVSDFSASLCGNYAVLVRYMSGICTVINRTNSGQIASI